MNEITRLIEKYPLETTALVLIVLMLRRREESKLAEPQVLEEIHVNVDRMAL